VAFPTPVHLAANGLWLWGDVVAWHRANGGGTTDAEVRFPSIEDHGAIDAYIYTQRRSDVSVEEPVIPIAAGSSRADLSNF
jgi:hypothetical protein